MFNNANIFLTRDTKRCNVRLVRQELITAKMTPKALKLLRLLAIKTLQKQYVILEQALQEKWNRVKGLK